MAIFFDQMPREIRDIIYELLLVNSQPGVHFSAIRKHQRLTYNDPFPKIDLHTAILRTCKQAYAEGLPMLYERNAFTYVSYTNLYRATIASDNPLKDNTRSIKHVRDLRCLAQRLRLILNFSQFKLIHHQANVDSDNENPLTTVRFLAAVGCSLSTLHLTFTFYPNPGETTTYTQQPYYEDLLKNIAALIVESKIVVRAKTYVKEYTTGFDYMANYLGFIKQWAITEDVYVVEPWNGKTIHTQEWILRPADASTIHKVPSSDKVDEIYRTLKGLA